VWIIAPPTCESSPCSLEFSGWTLASNWPFPDLASSVAWRGSTLPAKSWHRKWKMGALSPFLSGLTLEPLTVARGVERWISSVVDSRARTSVAQDAEPGSRVQGPDSGGSSTESFARFDRDTSSWRTSELCLFGGSMPYSDRWPKSGSMRNGCVFERPTWEPRTVESGCSSWPTACSRDWRSDSSQKTSEEIYGTKGRPLARIAMEWPTATSQGAATDAAVRNPKWASPHANCTTGSGSQGRDGGDNLQTQVTSFPSSPPVPPTTGSGSSSGGPGSRPQWESLRCGRRGPPGAGKRHRGQPKGKRLNPLFVAWLMNLPYWWGATESISCERSAMGLYLSRQRAHLRNLFGG
jgi:hypothetical protein